MNHILALWLALVCGSVLSGASIVGLLVSERTLEPASAATALLGFVLAAWGLGQLTAAYQGLNAVGYALFFAAAAAAGGYALASTLLPHVTLSRTPPLVPDRPAQWDTQPAVVVLSELEPPTYSMRATASALEDLAQEGLLSASIWVLPFLFMAQKTRYRAAGGTSPGASELEAVTARLALALAPRGITYVETAACDGEHSLSIRVAAAVERGFRTIVVAQASVAESLEVDRAKREVDSLRLSERGVKVSYADPLWGSARCAALVASKALAVADDPLNSGIVLVGQAQPEERSRIAGSFDQHETGFLNQIRMMLVDEGVPDQQVRIAWADWRSPEVTESVRHLAALGCRTVVVLPACFPLDSIATMLDIPLSVRQARVNQSVNVLVLHAWHDDPRLVEVLRAQVLSALDLPDAQSARESSRI
jgi:hypothetical protein